MFFNCQICKDETPSAFKEVHHVFPQSAGGKDFNSDGTSNTITICATCHGTLHTVAVMLRGKKAGTVEDVLSYFDESPAKQKIIDLAKELNRAHILKKDGVLNLEGKEEPISLTLPVKYKKALKALAKETKNPITGRKFGVSSYTRHLLLSHIAQKFPNL